MEDDSKEAVEEGRGVKMPLDQEDLSETAEEHHPIKCDRCEKELFWKDSHHIVTMGEGGTKSLCDHCIGMWNEGYEYEATTEQMFLAVLKELQKISSLLQIGGPLKNEYEAFKRAAEAEKLATQRDKERKDREAKKGNS